ncbi:hypothetical protein CP985_11845 [Malaciobacter mytili LMG 24559]|uniref:Uncharacterized protein n=1 Tax=Malaciobacter mytili LMG 24559 TaxID=1032238 RepID=A0AAX2AF92_9BACT|nr:hypothetical protein [Malaciobacter mytili]AXH16344.1 hypothetical protein AMYT_a0044 [Malaciobacter mytili LMG 24559]RXK14805.1 hypothetical protein CP985_11845 [Malaciobacter mytili LMG 24559]
MSNIENLNKVDSLSKEQIREFFINCAKQLYKNEEVEFIFKDKLYNGFVSSNGGYEINSYEMSAQKDEDDCYNDEDILDGGLNEGTAYDAIFSLLSSEDIEKYYEKNYFVINAQRDSSVSTENCYIVEIGQENFLNSLIEWYENIILVEEYPTEDLAIARCMEVNDITTNNWKDIVSKENVYTVFVGGTEINDTYLSFDEALKLLNSYKEDNYDDVYIMKK